MARAGRPTQSRSVRRGLVADQLLQAVTELLDDGGTYADLSVNAMAAHAGLSKATFYRYFTSKNELLSRWFEQVIEATQGADSWLSFDRAPTADDVHEAITVRVDAYRPYLVLGAAAFEAAYFDVSVRATVDELLRILNDALAAHVRFGQAEGWIDPQLPPREIAMWLNWMVSRGLHKLVLGANPERAGRLLSEFSRLVWATLYAPCQEHDARARSGRAPSSRAGRRRALH
jgi:AcrR family transcriptional regulator